VQRKNPKTGIQSIGPAETAESAMIDAKSNDAMLVFSVKLKNI
jgi:hypothetical protein